jgi:hypothetical protein
VTNTHAIGIVMALLILKQEGSLYDYDALASEAADILVAANKEATKPRAKRPRDLLSSMTPDWCYQSYKKANPGAVSFPPSLYLVDFARAVVRHMEGVE